jgi:diguanylate cyclase (GGDEF)-like protein
MTSDAPALLIVHGVEQDRATLREIFRDRYDVLEADSAAEALEKIEHGRPRIGLVVLAMDLPDHDGLHMLHEMFSRGILPGIPVMMIAPGISNEKTSAAIRLGVLDFIELPYNVEIIRNRAQRIVEGERMRANLDELVEARTLEYRRANRYAIEALSTIVEFRSGETAQHTRRISLFTRIFCQALSKHYVEYNLSDTMIDDIVCASALHDVGMIAVPEAILIKPGRLTDKEFEIMKRHTIYGADVIERIATAGGERFFAYCKDICLCHHERWDGNGYPSGLSGDAIPLWAQVVALADVYEALTSERVYKPPFTHEQALVMIEEGDCGAFNPKLLTTLDLVAVRLKRALDEMQKTGDSSVGDSDFWARYTPRAIKLLEHEREQYKTYASLAGEVLIDYDVEHDALSFTGRFSDHFDGDYGRRTASIDEVLNRYLYPGDRAAFDQAIASASASKPTIKMEVRLITKRGWYEWYEVIIRTLWSEDGERCVRALGKLTNVDQVVRETNRLREQATRDVLTGLLNRVETERCIKQRLAEGEDVGGALLYIDIDNFKQINDAHGHCCGDDVLHKMGQVIRSNIRETDIAGRIGGDEFIVYLDRVRSEEGIIGNVDRLISVVRQGFQVRAEQAPVSVSIGIARFPQDGVRYETLLEKADQAMYSAKFAGKGRYAFYLSEQPSRQAT